ncbi:hypothetical protein RHOER0001_5948 [Rhodococcus erythropolis SK121]|nr:hypothetical protein RHOER0001_5948 [Rhodococcus erythropolis SK121]
MIASAVPGRAYTVIASSYVNVIFLGAPTKSVTAIPPPGGV